MCPSFAANFNLYQHQFVDRIVGEEYLHDLRDGREQGRCHVQPNLRQALQNAHDRRELHNERIRGG